MTNGKLTELLLKSISQRLSGREDCKDMTYDVKIDNIGIHMYPIIYVYPNCHRRKESDKIDVLTFILATKFQDVVLTGMHDQFVQGTYRYSLVDTEKKRRWRKINET